MCSVIVYTSCWQPAITHKAIVKASDMNLSEEIVYQGPISKENLYTTTDKVYLEVEYRYKEINKLL